MKDPNDFVSSKRIKKKLITIRHKIDLLQEVEWDYLTSYETEKLMEIEKELSKIIDARNVGK